MKVDAFVSPHLPLIDTMTATHPEENDSAQPETNDPADVKWFQGRIAHYARCMCWCDPTCCGVCVNPDKNPCARACACCAITAGVVLMILFILFGFPILLLLVVLVIVFGTVTFCCCCCGCGLFCDEKFWKKTGIWTESWCPCCACCCRQPQDIVYDRMEQGWDAAPNESTADDLMAKIEPFVGCCHCCCTETDE